MSNRKIDYQIGGPSRMVENTDELLRDSNSSGFHTASGGMIFLRHNQYPGIGGGWLYYDAASTATIDNVNVFGTGSSVGRWLRVRESIPQPSIAPISPLELLTKPAAYWTADYGVTEVHGSVYPTDTGNACDTWIMGYMTATAGAADPFGGHSAWRFRMTTYTGGHNFIAPGVTGTVSAHEALEYEIICKMIGGAYLYPYDANDANPAVTFDGKTVLAAAGNVVARVADLGDGWSKLTMVFGAGTLYMSSTVGLNFAVGDASGFANVVGSPSLGVDVYSVNVRQYSRISQIASRGTLTLSPQLTGSSTTNSTQLVPKSAANSLPGTWIDPSRNGLFLTTSTNLRAYFAPGHAFTVVISMFLETQAGVAISLFGTRSDGQSFTIGYSANGTLWLGWYGDLTYSMGVPAYLTTNRIHSIAVTYTGSQVSVWLNGSCVIRDFAIAFGTSNSDQIGFGPARDSVVLGCAIWGTALSETEVIGVSRHMAKTGDLTTSDSIEVQNAMLWNTAHRRRLPMSDLKLALDGTARTVTVRAGNIIAAGVADNHNGPAVFADGVFLGEMATPTAKIPSTTTFALPAGTRELVVRDGLSAIWDGMIVERVTVAGATVVMPSAPRRRIAVYGDSLSAGQTATNSSAEGWAALLRASVAGQYELSVFGSGGIGLYLDGWDANARTRFATELDEHLNGKESSDVFICAIGINDGTGFWASWGNSAANFGAALADLLDKLHAASPGTRFLLLAPPSLPLSPSAANIAAIGAQIMAVGAARSWCEELDLSTVTIEIDASDATHLHPNTAGHLQLHNAVLAKLEALNWVQ